MGKLSHAGNGVPYDTASHCQSAILGNRPGQPCVWALLASFLNHAFPPPVHGSLQFLFTIQYLCIAKPQVALSLPTVAEGCSTVLYGSQLNLVSDPPP